ncbi:hypothetical protein NDU88_002814 [Pleurodeles waltl]|uniref:Uncharacterized protein n=1 Tax=Pleurodeles waltl TaxID=8319 RepID=A0AAV7VDN5_PLEWA|nr:hypothetical protein NDU88_002814 [Pleurodeles waltl]
MDFKYPVVLGATVTVLKGDVACQLLDIEINHTTSAADIWGPLHKEAFISGAENWGHVWISFTSGVWQKLQAALLGTCKIKND